MECQLEEAFEAAATGGGAGGRKQSVSKHKASAESEGAGGGGGGTALDPKVWVDLRRRRYVDSTLILSRCHGVYVTLKLNGT